MSSYSSSKLEPQAVDEKERYTQSVKLLLVLIRWLPDSILRALGSLLFTRTTRELESACVDPAGAQLDRLLCILSKNKATEFGRAQGFEYVRSGDDFRRRVALSTWEDAEADIDRMVAGEPDIRVAGEVPFYATTSGTTGRRKLIPVPAAFRDECRVANRLLYRTTLMEMPGFIRGQRLSMRSPQTEDLPGGARAGSITVALSAGGPRAGTGREGVLDAVPLPVFSVKDFATRYYLCLRFAAQTRVSFASAINPSTLLLFARTLEERGPALAEALEQGILAPANEAIELDVSIERDLKSRARRDQKAAARLRASMAEHGTARMIDLFPNLVGLACWKGGSAPWYLTRLKRSYGNLPVLDYGYAASEGCFGAPLSVHGAASVLLPHGHFFEFMPEDEVDRVRAGEMETKLLHELEVGKRYFVVVTTSAGLYRYDMNDVVEVVGHHRRAPLVVFRQKGGAMASVTGEKLGEAHVVQAMDLVQARHAFDDELPIEGFAMAPVLPAPESGKEPHYVLAIDCGTATPRSVRTPDDEVTPDDKVTPESLAIMAEAFDRALCEVNEEYEAKRKSLRLAPAVCALLPRGALAKMRASRVAAGAPDAHIKIPHLSADGRLLTDLGLSEGAADLESRLPHRATS